MKTLKTVLAILLLAIGVQTALAQVQNDTVFPLTYSNKKNLVFDLWLHGAFGSTKVGYTFLDFKELKYLTGSVGMRGEFYFLPDMKRAEQMNRLKGAEKYIRNMFALRLCLGVGYTFDRLAYIDDQYRQSGVYGQRLNLEAQIKILDVLLGISADVLTKSQVHSEKIRYNDFSRECLNPVALRGYVGWYASISFVEFEVHLGTYLIPIANPNLYAYHNMNKLKMDGIYTEVLLSFRLFTNGYKL